MSVVAQTSGTACITGGNNGMNSKAPAEMHCNGTAIITLQDIKKMIYDINKNKPPFQPLAVIGFQPVFEYLANMATQTTNP
jgi:hypothetical protein